MPRKKAPNPRSEIVQIRMTARERANYLRRAQAAGQKPADYGRAVLLEGPAAVARNVRFKPGHEYAAAALAEQVRRVGVNLNQWVRAAHEKGEVPPREATLLLPQIQELVRQAQAHLGP